jgi:hypothetical protein
MERYDRLDLQGCGTHEPLEKKADSVPPWQQPYIPVKFQMVTIFIDAA